MHARSIALSGRGPNAVMLDCNDGLIVPRGSQLGRATAAGSRDALSVGFHQPTGFGVIDQRRRTACLVPLAFLLHRRPRLDIVRIHLITHCTVHRSTYGPLASPQNLPTGIDEFGWMCAIGVWGSAHPRHRHAHRRLGWLSPEHSRPVQLVPAERQSGHRRRTYGVRLQPPALDVLACW
jgi:hypothetical protein